MARRKQTLYQRSFSFMETREDLLEGDDLDLRQSSLQSAKNMRSLASRATEARPGMFYVRDSTGAKDAIEIRPAKGKTFGLIVGDVFLEMIDETGFRTNRIDIVPWSSSDTVWVEKFRQKTVIGGSFGLFSLDYNDGNWSLTEFQFDPAAGGELAQPYWAFETSANIQPSARNGTITVTADQAIWTSQYVGLRIRYGFREILITDYLGPTVLRGTVVNDLPPTFIVTVQNASEYRVGEAVIGADTGYEGIVVGVSGSNLTIATLEFFDGPDVGEELSGPSGSSAVTASVETDLAPSPIWDEPLISSRRGYPGAAASASGRLILLDFPEVQDVIAVSSSRDFTDFFVGASDDDAIVRRAGDNSPRWLHAVNMGDVVLLADNGIYYIPTRDNGVLSPSTFNVVFVDEVGASDIAPVKVEDGIVFVEASGERVSAALLDGNVYLKWSVRAMTTYHAHLIKNPVKLCGPSLGAGITEKYIFVINEDGTIASISWQASIRDEQVGFAPWDTAGQFVSVSPMFGGYWALVDREIEGGTQRMLERFSTDAFLDSCLETDGMSENGYLEVNGENLVVNGNPLTVVTPAARHIPGMTASIYSNGWDVGDFVVNTDGTMTGEPDFVGVRQVGLNFEAEIELWPAEIIDSGRIGTLKARVLEALISVQNTLGFDAVCNKQRTTISAYQMGDDLTQPPVPRTKVYRFSIFGNRDHPTIKFIKTRPGPFRVLATGQRVQG